MNKTVLGLAGLIVAGSAAVIWSGSSEDDRATPTVNAQMHGAGAASPAPEPEDIVMPERLSSPAQMGQIAFRENCASCHGRKGAGTDQGPPLIHKIYEPSHHADFAFQRAAEVGVQAHHWRFGDMPPVEGVTDKQIEWITRYSGRFSVPTGSTEPIFEHAGVVIGCAFPVAAGACASPFSLRPWPCRRLCPPWPGRRHPPVQTIATTPRAAWASLPRGASPAKARAPERR